ncbi:glycosyltransferase [Haloarchaeobius amylolyticus]|uniref:Glycosyltransferase n=1 Tax=Haloarchaeobius amylolyticus TaxID=1198296 RepID=A0ABD6BE13_9EURY
MTRKQILMLNYEYPPLGGGAANANKYLLDEFADQDDIVIDLVTSSQGEYQERSIAENITLYRLNVNKNAIHYWTQAEILRYSWKAYQKSRELIRHTNYDLVHAWFGVPSGIIANLLGIPYIVALRGSDVPGYNERFSWQYVVLKPLIRKVWQDAESVIANSQGLRELALETSDVLIDVIPNGVSVDEFNPEYHNRDTLHILCVSRLIERKGVDDLIKAVDDLDVKLTIVGDGEQAEALQDLAVDLGIEERITFTGYIPHDEINEYYETADLFVLPSKNEGMSNTVLEAMAAGLPIITTNTGGTEELIHGNGMVVPPEDPDAISEAISRYDKESIRAAGNESRQIVEKMSWGKVADRYKAKYREI